MKVKVTKPFCDKFNLARLYEPGEVVDFEQKRADDIVSRSLGEYWEETPKTEEPKAEVKTDAEEKPSVEEKPLDETPAAPKKKSGRKTRK